MQPGIYQLFMRLLSAIKVMKTESDNQSTTLNCQRQLLLTWVCVNTRRHHKIITGNYLTSQTVPICLQNNGLQLQRRSRKPAVNQDGRDCSEFRLRFDFYAAAVDVLLLYRSFPSQYT